MWQKLFSTSTTYKIDTISMIWVFSSGIKKISAIFKLFIEMYTNLHKVRAIDDVALRFKTSLAN